MDAYNEEIYWHNFGIDNFIAECAGGTSSIIKMEFGDFF